MSVAVLIVNFRVYQELDALLGSLEPFLDAGDEVVVFDQASDREALQRVADRHPRAQVIASDENVGFAAGVNAAARHTVSPYLLLLNPDALVENAVTRILESWLAAHPDTAVAGPRVLELDGRVQASARRFPGPSAAIAGRSTWLTRVFPQNWLSRRNLVALDARGPVDVDWLAGSCFMTRRDVFAALGGLDERFFLYWEDADYCRRVAALGWRRMYVPDATVRHFGGRSAALESPRAIRAFHAGAYRLYRKHATLWARPLLPIARAGLWLRGELRARRAARRP